MLECLDISLSSLRDPDAPLMDSHTVTPITKRLKDERDMSECSPSVFLAHRSLAPLSRRLGRLQEATLREEGEVQSRTGSASDGGRS